MTLECCLMPTFRDSFISNTDRSSQQDTRSYPLDDRANSEVRQAEATGCYQIVTMPNAKSENL